MPAIPNKITTASLLDESKQVGSYGRPYLGMSSIGGSCDRKLWYGFHWVNKSSTNARTQRIFRDGHTAEAKIISDLKSIGYFVFKIENGKEVEMTGSLDETQEEIIGFSKHALGHPDGRVRGVVEAPKTDHLLEMKTANDKSFKLMQTKGIQVAKPTYYVQTQMYMHKLHLTRTLFVVYNKNDSSYYIERIRYDKSFAEDFVAREKNIILSDAPPKKMFSPMWHECKWCNNYGTCHENKPPEQNCRTCEYSDLEDDGVWTCAKKSKSIDIEMQKEGCNLYKTGWGL